MLPYPRMSLSFRRYPGEYAVSRLDPQMPLPSWAASSGILSVTRTPNELSIVCPASIVPPGTQSQPGWACLELIGPFPFHLTGILSAFLAPLAQAEIPIFALSTFDTDWVLVPETHLAKALQALRAAGHNEI